MNKDDIESAKGIKGHREGGDPEDERENFYICQTCGQPVDMRDLYQVMHHEQPVHKPIPPEEVKP